MLEPNHTFDQSFYVLCVVGHWILVQDVLATPEGREKVKDAFRSAMLAGGSIEALEEIPEFRAAMRDVERASETISIDPSAVTPVNGRTV
jgi:hypothetical protein